MGWLALGVALVALAVAGWAVYLASLALVAAGIAAAELKAHQLEHATGEVTLHTNTIRQQGDEAARQTAAIRAATARIEALKRRRLH